MIKQTIKTIAFDADDTLWHNEQHFQITQQYFAMLLADYSEAEHLAELLLETEQRNLAHFGYGVKGFTLSMIETAIEVTQGKVPASVIQQILDAGRDMLASPVELLPDVRQTLETLKKDFALAVITKGDLFDQERKLAQSGLGGFFDHVEIVSQKDVATYSRIFSNFDGGASATVMAGNSIKSDVIPVIEAGGYGVYIPSEITWQHEQANPPEHKRYSTIKTIGQMPKLVAQIQAKLSQG